MDEASFTRTSNPIFAYTIDATSGIISLYRQAVENMTPSDSPQSSSAAVSTDVSLLGPSETSGRSPAHPGREHTTGRTVSPLGAPERTEHNAAPSERKNNAGTSGEVSPLDASGSTDQQPALPGREHKTGTVGNVSPLDGSGTADDSTVGLELPNATAPSQSSLGTPETNGQTPAKPGLSHDSAIRRATSRLSSISVESERITALPTLPPNIEFDLSPGLIDTANGENRGHHEAKPQHGKAKTQSHRQDDIEASWSGAMPLLQDSHEGSNTNHGIKWLQSIPLCLVALCITMAATVLDVSMRFAIDSFEAPARASVLAAPIFLLGQALGSLFWKWPMRRLGQKACLAFGFTAFVGFQLPIIAARGVATILMLRFFAGLMGCAPLLGIINLLVDLWLPEDCAITSSVLSSFLIIGPLAGRIIGAFVTESTSLGWRWPSLIISGVSIFVGIVCWLVWSRPAAWLRCIKRSVRAPQKICARSKGPDEDAVHHRERLPGYTWTSIRRLILDPTALLVSVHTSYVYSLLFFVTETYPLSFEDNRHWSTGQGVVPLVSVIVGVLFGWALNFVSSYERLMKPLTSKVYTRPETHLQVMAVGAVLTPIGLLVAAWTSFPNLSPVAQVMAGTPIGMGIILVFLKGNDFLLEIHDHPDSFTAVNIVLRSALAAMFAGVSRHFYEDLGPQKTGTVMGLVSLVFVAIPILLMNARFKIRKSSDLPTHRTVRTRDTGE